MEKQKWHEWLHRYVDNELAPSEKEAFEKMLASSEELQEELAELTRVKDVLGQQEFRFRPFFTGRLMHRIEQLQQVPAQFTHWSLAFKSVAIPGMVVILLLLLNTWVTHGSFSLEALAGVSELAPEDLLADYFSH